ncbi:MAG: DUF2147 domain-containing protein [Bacteroidales bacterium]|nr:DUF2147 domain-containing protein [Bacteroidales bacterium]
MKNLIFSLVALFCAVLPSFAQNALNDSPDNIVGTYYAVQSGNESKVKISKAADGSYSARIIWVKNSVDPATGKKYTDVKNPNRALRDTPCDQIQVFWGLKYNADKKCWMNGKIYDPTRGLNANCNVEFAADGRLKIRGQVMGIGETVYWKKL